MGKYTSSATSWAHTSDATFRAWVIEFQAAMAGCGLVLTSDTGQIDTSTVVRPAINTNAGFNIYRFSDSLQSTAPIFIRVDYGTGSGTTIARLQVSMGIATDGAGSFAGTAIKLTARSNRNVAPGAGNYITYAYHAAGVFWISFKYGSLSTAAGFGFMVVRTCDNDRTPNGQGAALISAPVTSTADVDALVGQLRFASPASVITDSVNSRYHTLPVGDLASSADGLTLQPYSWFLSMPAVQPCFGLVSYPNADIPSLTDFPVAPVGNDDGQYLALAYSFGAGHGRAVAPIWES